MRIFIIILLTIIFSSSYSYAGTTYNNGRKVVASAGTAEALTSSQKGYTQVTICAESDNTGVIAVGGSGVIASLSTRTGVFLNASDCYTIGFSAKIGGNLQDIYIDSTVSTDGVTYNSIEAN